MREKASEFFTKTVKEAKKLDIQHLDVPSWRRRPRRIYSGSDNTRFTSLHQFLLHNIYKLLI